jgi:hypothetical protein
MPKLEDYRKKHYSATRQVSDNVRSLSLAAIGIVWIFKVQTDNGGYQLPEGLYCPVILIFAAMALDFLQSFYSSVAWFMVFRCNEKAEVAEDKELKHSARINWPAYTFFYAKIICMAMAYGYLLHFLATRVLWK